jgi:hypothetical protein
MLNDVDRRAACLRSPRPSRVSSVVMRHELECARFQKGGFQNFQSPPPEEARRREKRRVQHPSTNDLYIHFFYCKASLT